MATAESEVHAARRQLQRVLASAGFSGNDRLARFLRFIVEQHLEGKDSALKESVIAIEVFGRGPDHDPQRDSIVRNEAGRLRARLNEYYIGEGKDDPLIIQLPKGGYVPRFRQIEAAVAAAVPVPETGERKPPYPRFWFWVALTGLAVVLAGMAWWWSQHKGAPIAIAVLPLENLGHDPANEDFADGLTDELIRNLSVIEGLAVRSRTSSFALKGRPRNVREAGKQLEADYILEGSVLRAGQQLRVNTQLVRVRDDFPLWSGRFDRELTDVFGIQDEISQGIVNNLRLKLGRGRRRYETSVEAYDLYLRARALARLSVRSLAQNIGTFEQVIAKDPSFAPAYAGLAAAYANRSIQFWADHPNDELSKMRKAAEKALQLDPLLAEAHSALGLVYARDGQWEQAERSFRRSIELDPNDGMTHANYAYRLLTVLGRIDQALRQARLATKADPLSPMVRATLAIALISAGRYDEAAAYCMKSGDAFKSHSLARVRLGQGRPSEAIRILASDPDLPNNPQERGFLGYAYARAGHREEAEKMAANSKYANEQALIYAGLGDKDRTLEALDRMTSVGPQRIGIYLTYPELALLRGDPRVNALRKKVGLPE